MNKQFNDTVNPRKNLRIKATILVGICSCFAAQERRKAVRNTWLKRNREGIRCVFFLGGRQIPTDGEEGDVIMLDAPDGYHELPVKVFEFFKYALDHYDFDWLFKCDDDTYVDLQRLPELPDGDYDLIGDVSVAQRGAPSGGAGYFLSRLMVKKIVVGYPFPPTGAEDLIVGAAVTGLGGKMLATRRLYMANTCYPHQDNDLVTAHWCSSAILKALDTLNQEPYVAVYEGTHQHWRDELFFYANGVFKRKSTRCYGWWHFSTAGVLDLKWQAWALDQLMWKGGVFMGSNTILKCKEGWPGLHSLINGPGIIEGGGISKHTHIHLGCGNKRIEGWVNLDTPNYDAVRPLPWGDDEIDAIYLGKRLNLFSSSEVISFFGEVWRVLKPGGVMRFTVTDMDLFFHETTPELHARLKQQFNKRDATATEMLFHIGKYRSLWNIALLQTLLESLGFEITTHQTGESNEPYLRGLEQKIAEKNLSYDSLGMACLDALKP